MRIGRVASTTEDLALVAPPALAAPLTSPERVRLAAAGARPAAEPDPTLAAIRLPLSPTAIDVEYDLRALTRLLPRLANEDVDAAALEALGPAQRAEMAPRLSAVRRMARAAAELLDLRLDVETAGRGGLRA